MQHYTNYNLRGNNSLRLNSIAKDIWFPESIADLVNLNKTLDSYSIIAGGTNLLLRPIIDKVVCLSLMPRKINKIGNVVSVDAGVSTSCFINKMIESKFKGLENLIGIPGSLGGAVIMNAGSLGIEISKFLVEVKTLNKENKIIVYKKEELQFGRRYSILQDKKEIVTNLVFKFEKGSIDEEKIKQARIHRKTMPKKPSAGGFFKNWHSLKSYQDQLIGLRIGDAEVSKSVNIIINKGKATFNEIEALVNKIKSIVKEPLELEVKII
jgi:UDP-N-acetylmuramate dehydrogenase